MPISVRSRHVYCRSVSTSALLDERRQRQRARARARLRVVRHVDGHRAQVAEAPRADETAAARSNPRGAATSATTTNRPFGERRGQRGLLAARDRRRRRSARPSSTAGLAVAQAAPRASSHARPPAICRDVLGRRAAAAADEPHAGRDEPAGVAGHVVRRAQVEISCRPRRAAGRRWAARPAAPPETRAIVSIVSSIAAGPTEQLRPMTSAPARSSSGANVSGGVPSSVWPSSPVVSCATIGSDETRAHGANGGRELADVDERLEDEEVDAALDERARPVRGTPRRLRRGSCGPTARCGRRAARSSRPPRRGRPPRAGERGAFAVDASRAGRRGRSWRA